MSFISSASGASIWKGYEYYKDKKVLSRKKVKNVVEGTVMGSQQKPYQVHIDTEHPRKSHCNCPFADGRRVICKHMMALYFTAYPKDAAEYLKEVEEYETEQEKYYENIAENVTDCINRMSKQELREVLCSLLWDGPEWQFEKFVREHIED